MKTKTKEKKKTQRKKENQKRNQNQFREGMTFVGRVFTITLITKTFSHTHKFSLETSLAVVKQSTANQSEDSSQKKWT